MDARPLPGGLVLRRKNCRAQDERRVALWLSRTDELPVFPVQAPAGDECSSKDNRTVATACDYKNGNVANYDSLDRFRTTFVLASASGGDHAVIANDFVADLQEVEVRAPTFDVLRALTWVS